MVRSFSSNVIKGSQKYKIWLKTNSLCWGNYKSVKIALLTLRKREGEEQSKYVFLGISLMIQRMVLCNILIRDTVCDDRQIDRKADR